MRFMLDTNICIYAIKNRSAEVLQALRTHEAAGIGVSSITVAELFFGIEKKWLGKKSSGLATFSGAIGDC